MSVSRTKKILVPLATLTVAGAIAVGSGATFTSTSGNTVSTITTGSLKHTNSKDGAAVFALTNLKPGDTVNGSLVIKNTGTLPASFGLTETSSTNGFADKVAGDNLLKLTITNVTTGTSVYSGNFGGLADGTRNALADIAPDVSNTFRFSVTLDQSADNTQQGKTATAVYAWDSVQLAGETFTQ